MRRTPMALAIAAVLAMAPADMCRAQFGLFYEWNDPAGGSYAAGSNWLPFGVPDAANEGAGFSLDAAYNVDLAANYTVGDLFVGRGDVRFLFDPPSLFQLPHRYTTGGLSVEPAAGSAAHLTLDDGVAEVQTNMPVGSHGNARLTLLDAGLITAGARLGTGAGSEGHVIVDHVSSWTSSAPVVIGGAGRGRLELQAGTRSSAFGSFTTQGDATMAGVVLGQSSGGSGTAIVHGIWLTGDLIVGDAGAGEVTLQATEVPFPASTLSSAGRVDSLSANIAAQPGSAGTVNVVGFVLNGFTTVASEWNVSSNLAIGGTSAAAGGVGRLAIGGLNQVSVGADLRIWSGGALSLTEHGVLAVTGAAELDGALEFLLASTADPQLEDEFPILTAAGGVTGEFSALALPSLDEGLRWVVDYEPTTVSLRVAASFTADFDADGDVDGDDLIKWQDAFGPTPGSDADDDGDSDGTDFLAWQQELGSGSPALPTVSSVPEPASATLFAICGLLLLRRAWIRCVDSSQSTRDG